MKKLFKRITAVCVAVVMMTTVLCTYAFAYVNGTPSGNSGNYNIHFSYSVGSGEECASRIFRTSNNTSYSVSFSTVRATSASIYFINSNTGECDDEIFAPQAMSGGMPDSFTRSISLAPNTWYQVRVRSRTDGITANGYLKIFGVESYYPD